MTKLNYFSQLDGLRFLATLAVMVQHWIINESSIQAPLGFIGVTLFFVLSGFLISRILIVSKEHVSEDKPGAKAFFGRFYYRRVLRILPLYFLTVGLMYLFGVGTVRDDIAWLLTHAINFKFSIQGNYDPWVNHFWSLSIEEQYYLFYPLLIFVTPRKHYVKLMLGLVLVSLVSKAMFLSLGYSYRSIGFLTSSCLDSFGLGGLLAYLYLYKQDTLRDLINGYGLIAALFIALAIALYFRSTLGETGSYQRVWFRLLVSSFSFWLIGKAIFGFTGIAQSFLEHPWISYLGKISYGLYVYHNFVHYAVEEFAGENVTLQPYMLPIYFIITVAVSSLSWHTFEKPICDLKNR